jgi:tetratricopeptide (TPR) repeat protein
VYLLVEALPDIGLVGQSFKVFPRRKRIGQLEAIIRDNPSPGNYEELGDLYMDDGRNPQAREAFDRAIAARADTPDPFYRRGVCAIQMGDFAAAVPDLERVVAKQSDYDFQRAAGLLAHAYAQTGQKKSRVAISSGDYDFNALGNLPQFCRSAGLRTTHGRSPRVDTESIG